MSNRFINQSRHAMLGICATLAISGFYACTDSYDLDDKGNIPTIWVRVSMKSWKSK